MKAVLAWLTAFVCMAGAASAENVFHVGDAVEISVVGYEDDLNGIYRVGPEGAIEVPYVGPVQVAGLTLDALKGTLRERIWALYINHPDVIVKPLYTVTILGSVFRPGAYQIEGGERLSTLLAMAGGERQDARLSGAKVTRDGEVISGNLKEALQNGKTINDIGMQSGDVIYVPTSSWWRHWTNWAVVISSVSLAVAVYDRINN